MDKKDARWSVIRADALLNYPTAVEWWFIRRGDDVLSPPLRHHVATYIAACHNEVIDAL